MEIPTPEAPKQPQFKLNMSDTTVSIIFGVIFIILLIGAALWPVVEGKIGSSEDSDSGSHDKKNGGIMEKIMPGSDSTADEDRRYVHTYANFGKFNDLPIGPWINLEKNIIPSLKSNVVVVMYMVHYQGPSKKFMPLMQTLYEENKNTDTVVIGVQQEYFGYDEQNRSDVVKRSMAAEGAYFPTVIDINEQQETYTKNFRIGAFPSIFVVDKFGNVRYRHDLGDREALTHAIETMQNTNTPSPPSVEELIMREADRVREASELENPTTIKLTYLKRLKKSPFYQVSVRVYEEGIDPNASAQYPEDHADLAIIIGADESGTWYVGTPFDDTYCEMLKQVELTHEEEKLYELIRCQ